MPSFSARALIFQPKVVGVRTVFHIFIKQSLMRLNGSKVTKAVYVYKSHVLPTFALRNLQKIYPGFTNRAKIGCFFIISTE